MREREKKYFLFIAIGITFLKIGYFVSFLKHASSTPKSLSTIINDVLFKKCHHWIYHEVILNPIKYIFFKMGFFVSALSITFLYEVIS
jgi:hypothetical protein